MSDATELLDRFTHGDRRALARILSLAESGSAPPLPVQEQSDAARPNYTVSRPAVIGITGSGGAGKSSLIAALIGHLRRLGKSVAVLASDPQSPLTGGALLGDRVRVQFDPADEGVYFRSLSTRGAQGGVAAATRQAIDWLAAFGFDVVLVETVGIGQDQIGVREWVDRLVLLVTPGSGDEIQWEKAGLVELADLIVVNKADTPGADRVVAALHAALTLAPEQEPPPIIKVVATSGEGIDELWQAVEDHSSAS